jgi:hypothetical protein
MVSSSVRWGDYPHGTHAAYISSFGHRRARRMAGPTLQPGDRVSIVTGAFAGMSGTVAAPAEVAARWPEIPVSAEVTRGEAVWVIVPVLGRDIPAALIPGWVARV